jgi:undecaprenyl-diphosphatase
MWSSFIEWLIRLDTQLFYLLNVKMQNPVLDFLMPILTNLDYWRIPFIVLAVFLLVFGKKRGRIVVVLLALGITLSDQVCNSILKPLIGRMRPCNTLENVHLLIGCSKAFSFPSSHATNIFTGMTIFSFVYPRLKYALYTIAVLVAYSRVYVGVHYPFDVIAGTALGIACAVTIIVMYKLISNRFPVLKYGKDDGKSNNQTDSR